MCFSIFWSATTRCYQQVLSIYVAALQSRIEAFPAIVVPRHYSVLLIMLIDCSGRLLLAILFMILWLPYLCLWIKHLVVLQLTLLICIYPLRLRILDDYVPRIWVTGCHCPPHQIMLRIRCNRTQLLDRSVFILIFYLTVSVSNLFLLWLIRGGTRKRKVALMDHIRVGPCQQLYFVILVILFGCHSTSVSCNWMI